MASRFYRFTMTRPMRYFLVLCLVLGWSLILYAAQVPPQGDSADDHIKWTATVLGSILTFMAIFGGVSRWVADPAARRALAEHVRNGGEAHKDLLPRSEYQEKHDEVLDKLSELAADVRALPNQVLLEIEGKGRR